MEEVDKWQMVTFIQGDALAHSWPRGELLSCYLLSLEILSDWKDILLSKAIDTLAHFWPRGELLSCYLLSLEILSG